MGAPLGSALPLLLLSLLLLPPLLAQDASDDVFLSSSTASDVIISSTLDSRSSSSSGSSSEVHTDPLPDLVSELSSVEPPLEAREDVLPSLQDVDGAEVPAGPFSTGTTIVTTSSTSIDTTTVVIISSTSTSDPETTATAAPPSTTAATTTSPRRTDNKTISDAGVTETPRRNTDVPDQGADSSASCDFGRFPTTTMCGWRPLPDSRTSNGPKWRPGAGLANNWVGGPASDAAARAAPEDVALGGYAFVETSEGAGLESSADKAMLVSPVVGPTGVQGACLSFMYSLVGLSARGLRVIVLMNSSLDSTPRTVAREVWHTPPPGTSGWHQGELLYEEHRPHQLLLEAFSVPAADPARTYRGHVAVDAISLRPGNACSLACTFAAGLCTWSNEDGDDFDWTMGRGSSSTATGPAASADFWVEPPPHAQPQPPAASRGLPDDILLEGLDGILETVELLPDERKKYPGGYVFVDSSYPRRPGDVARLVSEQLPASDPVFPRCLRFWFHMYGVDVGSLRVLVRPSTPGRQRVVWAMTGDAGNAWYRGAVTLADTEPFRVVLEAGVGAVGMSDVAVDNISLDPGPCPVAPQVAGALGARSPTADCSMEVDECSWRGNAATPGNALWERVSVATLPRSLQRRPHGPALHNEHFLALHMVPGEAMVSSTKLVSPLITTTHEPLCLAFWYLVHEPALAGALHAGLGALRAGIQDRVQDGAGQATSTTLWSLYNTQGPAWRPARVPLPANHTFVVELEGEWGPGRHSGVLAVDDIVLYHADCPSEPAGAWSSPADCSFSQDACSWRNSSVPAWQLAGGHHRPAKLSDNTYRAAGGYVFFDMFSLSRQVRRARLQSPTLDAAGAPVCFSFWFAAFGLGESTRLRLLRRDMDRRLPEVAVWQLNARDMDTARPQWMSAQAALPADSAFAIVLEGEATNGGFAVDDVRVRPGPCPTRPPNAVSSSASGGPER